MKIDNGKFDVALARAKMRNVDVAKMLGVTPGALTFMRHKAASVRPCTVGKLAKALGVDVLDIIEDTVRDFRIHDLRHVAATDLYNAGNPERWIMGQAGWKSPMMSTYYHKDSLLTAQKIVFNQETAKIVPFKDIAAAC